MNVSQFNQHNLNCQAKQLLDQNNIPCDLTTELAAVTVVGAYYAAKIKSCDHSPDAALNFEVYSLALGIAITIGEIDKNAPLITIADTTSRFEALAGAVSSRLFSDLAKA